MAEVCIYHKKSLKDCHKLCIIYIIFSPDPDKEIWDSSEGDWGLRKKRYSIFLSKFLTLLVKGGGVINYELQTCSFTSIKLPRYVTVTIIISMCR